MTLNISLDYKTVWGESLVLVADGKTVPMSCSGASTWSVSLDKRVPAGQTKEFEYTFEVRCGEQVLRKEWCGHKVTLCSGIKTYTVADRWMAAPSNQPFYSSVFKDIIFKREPSANKTSKEGNVTFKFFSPEIRPDQTIVIVGSGKLFASWNRPIAMDDSAFPEWSVTVNVTEPLEYKFVVVDAKTLKPIAWEQGENHKIAAPTEGQAVTVASLEPTFETLPFKAAGTAIPVFALRTEESFGVGDFHDIKKLVDWAVETGQNILQLLPINDTTMTGTWQDSYPYNANSTFALHPMYVNLLDCGVPEDRAYKTLRTKLNKPDKELGRYVVDYEKVTSEKTKLLKKAFTNNYKNIIASEEFKGFVKYNESWLIPYATFCVIRDQFGTPDFSQWGDMAKYNHIKAQEYAKAHAEEIDFHCYEQFCLDNQLKDAVQYAHSKGVAIKGDLPIGISRTSVDAWIYPSLFHMNSQAGAPPDAFSDDGQNWGFPTYNWEEMAKDDYAWWKARMKKMSEYFDAFRIDHILGFFRIWEIPSQYKSGLYGHFNPALPYSGDEIRSKGLDPNNEMIFLEDPSKPGYYHPRIDGNKDANLAGVDDWHKGIYRDLHEDFFYRRHNEFWRASAMKKLPALLKTTGMLTCGEDLGMIPACVPDVMKELGILSLEIQRMPKAVNKDFDEPWTYPYYSVCATGSHDTSNIRAWWEEDRVMTQKFYNNILGCQGFAPMICEPWICEKIVRMHVESPSMLCVLPLQDWMSIDLDVRYPGDPAEERINVPAIPRYYWRYRMHMTLESLIANTAFNKKLKDIVRGSGRNK